MSTLMQDLKYGLRLLVKNPGFTAVAVLTLALGIGANTAIFSILDAVLFRPLPYPHPERLVKVWTRFTGIGLPNDQNWVSVPEFRDVQTLNKSFSDVALITDDAFNISISGTPQRVAGADVTPSLFSILGEQARLGRTFLLEEGQPGHQQEVLLGYGFWKRGFGGEPNVIGRTIRVNDLPYTVVGVMPPGFDYPFQAEIWASLAFAPADLAPNNRGNHGYELLARVKPGLSMAQVREDMDRVGKTMIEQNRQSYPYQKYGFGIILHSLLDETVGESRTSLWVLMAAVGLVLLIACANVANLLLVRAVGRQKETAVRVALGASPGRLARQLLTESTLLALAGGLAGLALTPWVLRGLATLGATALPRAIDTRIDGWMLGFTLLVAVATGILFGLAPVLGAASRGAYDALKGGARSTSGAPVNQLRRLLVAGEAALSLILLAGAGLLLRSFVRVLQVDPGFRPEGVLTMRISLPDAKYSKPVQIRAFYRDLLGRIQSLPGVDSAGAVSALPLTNQNSGTITVDTHEVPLDDTNPEADYRLVTPGYFKAMGIGLIKGRYFNDDDSESSAPVAIVDETMVQTYWPHEDPIGRRLHLGEGKSMSPWMTIVGVVRHVRNRTLEARSRVELYWPETQGRFAASSMALAAHTTGDPMSLATTVEKEVLAVDADQPVYRVRTMTDVMADSVARRRLALILLAVFSGLALVLASIGIYGVSAYWVTQRQQEIGLRMALGARTGQVLGLVIGQGMLLILAGLGAGLVGALVLTRLMGSLLFAVRPSDPLTLGGAALLLTGVALIANYIPARRATKVDPVTALRYE